MISKQQAKFVKSLKLKKYRDKASAFVVEGGKNVSELLKSDFTTRLLFVTEKFISEYGIPENQSRNITVCSEKDLVSMGTFQSNEYALAVADMKRPGMGFSTTPLVLALDNIQDPGNLGTIIRIADWYGLPHIVASEFTADVFSPKVINASMGSFTRVQVYYTNLEFFIKNNSAMKVYGTFLSGENVHNLNPEFPAMIVLGNESSGISEALAGLVNHRITIPGSGNAESLNVAVSAAIICDNFIRHQKMEMSSPASSAILSATSRPR